MSIADAWKAWLNQNQGNFIGGEFMHFFDNEHGSGCVGGPITSLETYDTPLGGALRIETSMVATSPVDQQNNPTGDWQLLTHEGANQSIYSLANGRTGTPQVMAGGRVSFISYDGTVVLSPRGGPKLLPA